VPALILCVWLCVTVVHVRAVTSQRRVEIDRLRSDIAELRAERGELDQFFADSSTRLVTQQAAFLNAIIDERSFPWTQFFLDLEHRLPRGVRILTISPALSGDHLRVKMRVGALSDKSKLEFLKAIEEAPEFSALQLVAESRPARNNEENDVVLLDLEADYHATLAAPTGAAAGGGQ